MQLQRPKKSRDNKDDDIILINISEKDLKDWSESDRTESEL